VLRRCLSIIAVLFLLFPLASFAQHGGRHGSTPASGTATSPEDPDTATFKREVAAQATDDQVAQFRSMTKSTEEARVQAQAIQHLGPNDSEQLIGKAANLKNSIDQALSDEHKFRQSFTDSQQATLKSQTKKLTKSEAAISKSTKSLSHQLDQTTPSATRLVSTVANLEKAIDQLQSDQLGLGKQMGIESH
jgi:hypothetical protein